MVDPTWARVEEVFHRTRGLPPGGRASALAELTEGAPDVRRQVEALLAAHDRVEGADETSRGFLGTLDPEHAGALLAEVREAGRVAGTAASEEGPGAEGHDSGGGVPETIGRYRVERLLGRGGMGRVFLAHDPRLGRPVALKLLAPGVGADRDAWDRVLAEARASSALDHPNIATVYDAGRSEAGPYVAMAYYPGQTLRERLAEGPVGPDEAVAIARGAAEGLGAAHAAGIVHRDVKPENLVLGSDGAVRVVDFGIARAVDHATAALPRGTVAYMSPEQTRGRRVEARSDVWALGVVLYEMVAGRRPFGGDAPDAVIHAIRHDEPAPLPEGDHPPGLEDVVRRCLARDPGDRFADGAEVAAALGALVHDGGRAIASSAASTRPAVLAHSVGGRGPARARWLAGAGLVILALVALVGLAARIGGSASGTVDGVRDVVLADFSAEAGAAPVGRAVTEALRIDLHQSGALRLVDEVRIDAALARMGRAPGSALPEEVAREIAQRDGYAAVVAGTVAEVGAGWLLTARVLESGGATVIAVRETAPDSATLVAAVDRLAKRLRDRLGESADALRAARPLPEVATASLPALTRYAEAYRLTHEGGDQSRAVALLEDAVAFDPEFAAAHRALSVTLWNMRADRTRVVQATTRAYGLRDRLGSFEGHLAEAAWHWQVRGDPAETVAAYRRALHLRPRHPAASNNLALALMFMDRPGEAERVLRDATGPGTPGERLGLMRQNLARALYLQGRTEEAYGVLDDLRSGRDGAAAAELERARWLAGDGRWTEADEAAAAFVEAHAERPQLQAEGVRLQWHLAVTRGRWAEAEALYARVDALLADVGAVEARARTALRRAEARRRLLGDEAGARAAVAGLLASSGVDPFRAGADLVPRAAAVVAAAGDTTRALDLLVRWEAMPVEERSDPDAFSPEAARARVALAGGRADEAVRRLEALVENNLEAVDHLPDLAAAYQAAGRPEDAAAALERFLATRHPRKPHRVSAALAPALRDLAALLDETGDAAGAERIRARLGVLLAQADPAVRGALDASRANRSRLP